MPALKPHSPTAVAVDDEQRRDRVGRRVHAAEVELRLRERTRRGDEHRHHVGGAAGEDRVDRHEATGDAAEPRGEDAEDLVGVAGGAGEHLVDPRR